MSLDMPPPRPAITKAHIAAAHEELDAVLADLDAVRRLRKAGETAKIELPKRPKRPSDTKG